MYHLMLSGLIITLFSLLTTDVRASNIEAGLALRPSHVRSYEHAADRDNDGLSDEEEIQLGTDPGDSDSDDDALLDGWEVRGVNGINLAAMGASPLHKDVFVEMDFMVRGSATNGLGPNAAVLNAIVAVFAASPVTNPDGRTGINIRLERGNEVPYDPDLNPLSAQFGAIKNVHFDPRRAPVFHYMLWANGYNGGTSSGYSLGIPGSDFVVTLGKWNGGAGGTDNQKIGTFIHELGHNLDLTHGGTDHVGYKPNHLSVMNYSFQTRGIRRNEGRVFDFQIFNLPRLAEAALIETDGLGQNPALQGYYTIFYLRSGNLFNAFEVPCHAAIDWNRSGTINNAPVAVSINRNSVLETLRATPDEWAAISYGGGAIGSRLSPKEALDKARRQWNRVRLLELTEEMDSEVENSLLRGVRSQTPPLRELDEQTDRQIERSLRRNRRRVPRRSFE